MIKAAKDCLDIGVIVSDIKASLAFYRDTLGLQYIGSNSLWFGSLHRLRFGKSDFKLIDPIRPLSPGPSGLETTLGFRYVTFMIDNLDEICAQLIGLNVKFEKEPFEVSPGRRITMVHDPDGNIVELIEVS